MERLCGSQKTRVFRSLARGIQGAFVGHSRGIRVQKRVFRNLAAHEPIKTYGFLAFRKDHGDTELPFYNIKGEESPKKERRRKFMGSRILPRSRCVASSWGLEFYRVKSLWARRHGATPLLAAPRPTTARAKKQLETIAIVNISLHSLIEVVGGNSS